ncbi:MAG TPA: FAD-dependent oxidoreductase, partial [Thermomicrobiales bacterium]|nr:FAD-dependent oxidoreductase [Thermomicrobiales bacterium]
AVLQFNEPVRHWSADGAGVRVDTAQGTYQAARLVIAAGPWSAAVLAGLGLPLTVQRIVNVHFAPAEPDRFAPGRCPIYILSVLEGEYYGFPALPGQGVKFGRHDTGEVCTPATIRRMVDEGEVAALRAVLDRYLPGAGGDALWTLTCMYTNTPDRHFILDRHPAHEQVVYGCGFSGHGFKFSSVIGEILADLALDGATKHPIGFLSATRFVRA